MIGLLWMLRTKQALDLARINCANLCDCPSGANVVNQEVDVRDLRESQPIPSRV